MARVLIIDSNVKAEIKYLVDLATLNPVSLAELQALSKGFDPQDPKTQEYYGKINQEFTIELPVGFTVTYTHEVQLPGLCRHLSVSVAAAGMYPNLVAFKQIMALFGFKKPLKDTDHVWEEKYSNRGVAINVLEVID